MILAVLLPFLLLLPAGGAVHAGSYAYIANYGSNTVSVIDTADGRVIGTIRGVGAGPGGVAVAPGGAQVYVANYNGATVSVVDTATNVVTATIPVGTNPNDMAVLPDGSKVYVANSGSNSVSIISTASNTITGTVAVGVWPVGAVAHPNGSRIYVANRNVADAGAPGTVSVIDTATDTVVETISVGGHPHHMAVSPDGTRAYVANHQPSPSVSVIDTATNMVTATITGPGSPVNAAVTPDGTRVYVTNRDHDNVSVIDTATHVVIATIPVGDFPYGVSVTPDGSRVYVANAYSGTVSLINPATDTVIGTIAVGTEPYAHGPFITPAIAPPSGRVGWWKAENDTADAMGFNNGTAQGSVSYGDGITGRAFSFDVAGATVEAADSPSLDLTTHFTLEAWIYPTDINGDKAVISKVGGGCGNNGYQMGLGGASGSKISAFCSFNAAGEDWAANSVGGGSIPANAWSHVACTYDHETFTIYVNGIPVESKSVGAKTVADSCSTLHISGDDNNHVWFNGLIDEAAIYNRALSGREVAEAFGTIPGAFGFAARTDAAPLASIESEPITVSGIANTAAISVVGGQYAISTDGGTTWGAWTAGSGVVNAGDRVKVRLTSASWGATAQAVLTIGGGEATFSVTTAAASIPTTNLRLWLRADMGVTKNGSNQVSGCADFSGNGFAVAQGTAARQPFWVDGAFGGKPVLRFDGSDDYLETLSTIGLLGATERLTVFVVVQPGASQSDYADILDYDHGSGVRFAIQQDYRTLNAYSGPGGSIQQLSSGSPQVLAYTFVNGGAWASFVNGGSRKSGSGQGASFAEPAWFTIGHKSYAKYPRPFRGDIAEVIVYNQPLPDADRQTVEAYLIGKYGIDVTPETFTFPARGDAPLSGFVESDPVTVTGISNATTIAVTGGEYAISTDGGTTWGAWTGADGGVSVGHKVKVRLTSPASYAATAEAVLTIGGVAATFRVTTVATPSIPVSGLRLWLKADAGVTKSGTNQVSRWADFSGTGLDVAQATEALRPLWVDSAFSGQPALRFDGGDDYLETLSTVNLLGGTGQLTVMAVVQPGTAQQTHADILDYNHWEGVRFVLQQSGDQLNFFTGPGAPGQQLSSAAPQVVTYTFINGVSGTSRLNGLNRQSGSGSNGSFAEPSWLTIGNKSNPPNQPALSRHFRGDIAEVIVYNTVLDDADRQAVETYLMGKYGIDVTPGTFSFPARTDALLGVPVESDPVAVTGITSSTPISISGGEYAVSTDGGTSWGAWTSAAGVVNPGSSVKVRLTSAGAYAGVASATLTIGGISGSFSVTTREHIATGPGYAIQFNSESASHLNVPSSASLAVTDALTLEAWIRPASGGGEWALVIGKQLNPNDWDPWYSYRFVAASANSGEKGFPRQISFNVAPEGRGEAGVVSTTVVPVDAWTHVAGVYDGATLKIYINGQLEGEVSQTGRLQVSSLPLYIGRAPWTGNNNYNGLMDEIRIWTIARTAEQIRETMNRQLTGQELGLAGYWSCNEGSGSVASDASANGNTATLNSGAAWAASDVPLHLTLLAAAINAAGGTITLSFNNAMADPAGKEAQFSVTVDGTPRAVLSAALNADPAKIDLTLASPVLFGQAIRVTYTSGDVGSASGEPLAGFAGLPVPDSVPLPAGTILNQDGPGFSGTISANPLGPAVAMAGYGNWPAGLVRGGLAFQGGVFDGRHLWLMPLDADRAVKVDKDTGAMTDYNGWPAGFAKAGLAFNSGVFDGQSVWAIPYNADRLIRIDPETGVMAGYNGWPSGTTAIGNGAFAGGAFDGRYLWLVPFNADRLIRTDPGTGAMTGYNGWPAGFAKGDNAFVGAIFDGQNLWLIPYNADRVIRVDKDTGAMTGYRGWPSDISGLGNGAFGGGVFDGRHLWLIPCNADRLVRIDPETGAMTGYSAWPAGFAKGGHAFAGGSFDGQSLWLVPSNADRVIRIDKDTGIMQGYGAWPAGFAKGGNAFTGGVFDGWDIWLVPTGADRVVRIASKYPILSEMATSVDGSRIVIRFDEAMADPAGSESEFTVLVDGVSRTVTAAALDATDPAVIELTLASPVIFGQTIHLSYGAGNVQSAAGGLLAPFSDRPVANGIPRMIGDVNNDRRVDLADAVLSLKLLAGIDVSGTTVNVKATVEDNGRIGLEEAVFILQFLSGLRP